jgi:hypothetical protein
LVIDGRRRRHTKQTMRALAPPLAGHPPFTLSKGGTSMIRKLAVTNLVLLSVLLASAVVNVWTRDGIAQTVSGFSGLFSSLQLQATDPVVGNDSNDRRAIDVSCTTNDVNANTGFTDQNCVQVTLTANNGQNVYGGGTNAKRTFLPMAVTGNYTAAGQKFLYGNTINCWGMGDCAVWGNNALTYAGGPVAGDEGTGWGLSSGLTQQSNLTLASVTSVPAKSACATTLTQIVTGGYATQSVAVASTTGCNVNDWIVVNQVLPNGNYGYPNNEAVQITAVGSGTISGIFKNNQVSGATITPALVLNLNGTYQFGQQRKLVNLSQPSYSTGAVSAINGGAFTGNGTAWTANMVGGSTANIGCISLSADAYTGWPFGTGSSALNSWYEITAVSSGTSLGISSMSVAGDISYHGNGPGPSGGGSGSSAYVVRPCVEVLRVNGSQVIAESTSTTWSANDNVELAISPYPDVTGFQYYMGQWVPGGAHNSRGFEFVRNNGARQFQYGFSVESDLQTGSNADTVGWGNAFQAIGPVGNGLLVTNATQAAIALDCGSVCSSGAVPDQSGRIQWGSAYTQPNSATGGMEFQLDLGQSYPGNAGFLTAYGHNSGILGPGNSLPGLNFGGVFGTVPKTFAQLMTCSSAVEGFETAITDSTTATFAATISGGGSNHVKAYCNGTNWTVH